MQAVVVSFLPTNCRECMRCDGWYVGGRSVNGERSGHPGQHEHVLRVDKVMEVTWEPKQAAERDGGALDQGSELYALAHHVL